MAAYAEGGNGWRDALYVIGFTVTIHLVMCVLHALCMWELACLHVHILGFLSRIPLRTTSQL